MTKLTTFDKTQVYFGQKIYPDICGIWGTFSTLHIEASTSLLSYVSTLKIHFNKIPRKNRRIYHLFLINAIYFL